MTDEQYAEDLRVMIKADREHLDEAIERGNRTEAHRHLDSIIDNQWELEDLLRDR